MKIYKRRGFTLVELLIVIVVIGVLSGMMMLSNTEAVTSAKAAKIINNMTNIKKAVTAWYVDNLDKIVPYTNGNDSGYGVLNANGKTDNLSDFLKTNMSEILAYLSNGNSITLKSKRAGNSLKADDYIIKDVDAYKKWYVCYYVGTDKRLQNKLASRAKSLGLLGLKQIGDDISATVKAQEYKDQNFVCMQILSLAD